MRLESGLYIGREAVLSNGSAVSTVADNISNSNTTAFKGQRPEFGDLLADSIGSLFGEPLSAGNGVSINSISTLFTQGSIQSTERDLDFAVQGRGFFILNNGTDTFYTRAGNFNLDDTGNLVSGSGESVMGFTEASPETLVPLNLGDVAATAVATTTVTATGNLDATTPFTTPIAAPTSYRELNDATTYRAPLRIVDSLGQFHDVSLHFFHTDNLNWTVEAYADAADVGGTAGTPSKIGEGTIAFDATGNQATTPATTFSLSAAWSNGSAPAAAAVDLSGFTGFATSSATNSLDIDGTSPSGVSGFSIDNNGVIKAVLGNGSLSDIGTIALADFVNLQGLERIGDTKFVTTPEAGAITVGAPNGEGRGVIKKGNLEASNTDPSSDFISLISYQRGYQAGSKILTTINELLKLTINLG